MEHGAQDLGVGTVEVEISALALGGRGVARVEGLVWLVEGALPGDRAEVEAVRSHPRFVEATAVRILRPSPSRRDAVCPIQGECGGCAWMTLDESAQREWKRTLVVEALTRIGGIAAPDVVATISTPPATGYRNRVELSFGPAPTDGGAVRLGFHRSGRHDAIVDVLRCAIVDEVQNGVIAATRAFFHARPESAKGLDRLRLLIRRSSLTGGVLVAIHGTAPSFPGLDAFAANVAAAVPEVVSVVRVIAQPGRRGGQRVVPVYGPPWIDESLAGIRFRLPAGTFCQVNPAAAERLAEVVEHAAAATRGASILELYGGVGVFALKLAKRSATGTVVEADPEAVACGRRAAKEAGGLPVRFERSDVLRYLSRPGHGAGSGPEVVIADPPRAGLGRGVATAIAATRAPRVVLVSCDPATLARDVRALVSSGYRFERAVPIDMFPQTPHVEAVAVLGRRAD